MISILALYNYDDTIFEGLELPEGLEETDLINTILFQNAELPLVYTNPDTMKAAISVWSRTSAYSWEKLAATLSFEYNPIWNKDAVITENETLSGTGTGVDMVSAFDSSNFENRGKSESESETTREYEREEHGNIGLTSSQELIRQEREISRFNIYDEISGDFRNRFCIMVY